MKCEELGSGEVFSRVMFHVANAWDDGSNITLLGVALEKVCSYRTSLNKCCMHDCQGLLT